MNRDVENLHTAIRRYCWDRYIYWTENYSNLNDVGEGFSIESGYSDKALATYPRYNVLKAILTEIERHHPTDFANLEEAKEFFILIAQQAQDGFTNLSKSEIEQRAMSEERNLLCQYISQLNEKDLLTVEPLFYRYVLSKDESDFVWEKLRENWNVTERYWYPLTTWRRDDTEAFQDSYFEKEFGYEKLQDILRKRGIIKLWEMRENDINYEIELNIFEPYYDGCEGFWCDSNFNWLIYASHESSITFAGSILSEIKSEWSNWQQRVWTSPFFN